MRRGQHRTAVESVGQTCLVQEYLSILYTILVLQVGRRQVICSCIHFTLVLTQVHFMERQLTRNKATAQREATSCDKILECTCRLAKPMDPINPQSKVPQVQAHLRDPSIAAAFPHCTTTNTCAGKTAVSSAPQLLP